MRAEDAASRAAEIRALVPPGASVAPQVAEIIADVRERGDAALEDYEARFGGRAKAPFRLSGGLLAPLTGMVDGIVDLTATGTTLRENGLVVREEIMHSTARLIANPVSYRVKAAEIDGVLERLRAG